MHAWLTHTTVLYICEFDTILSQKTPSPFDTQMQMTSLYLFLIISLKKKNTSQFPFILSFSIYPLVFIATSLYVAQTLVIVQQWTSLCMLSKRKSFQFFSLPPIHFDRLLPHFAHVQWIIKRSVKLLSCSEVDCCPLCIFPQMQL